VAAKKRKSKTAAEPKRKRSIKAELTLKVEHVPELHDHTYRMYRAKLVGSSGSITLGSFLAKDEKSAVKKARAAVRAAL